MSATQEIVLDPPLRGEWAILNPPGHPRLAFDFLATKGTRLPYAGTAVLPHVLGSIGVGTTYAWRQPVFAPLDGVVVACSDGAPDRERISMVVKHSLYEKFPMAWVWKGFFRFIHPQ